MSISVLLADDQPLLRRGFRMILETEDDLTVVAERSARTCKPRTCGLPPSAGTFSAGMVRSRTS